MHDSFELPRQVGLIAEATRKGDPGYGILGLYQLFAGFMNTDLTNIIPGGDMEMASKGSLKRAHRTPRGGRQIDNLDCATVVLPDVSDWESQFLRHRRRGDLPLVISGMARHRHDLTGRVAQWNLRRDDPVDNSLRGRYQLDAIPNGVAIVEESSVVLPITLRDVGRQKIGIGAADHFRLVRCPKQAHQFLVRREVAPFPIFHKKEAPRHVPEKSLYTVQEIKCRFHALHPGGPEIRSVSDTKGSSIMFFGKRVSSSESLFFWLATANEETNRNNKTIFLIFIFLR